MATSQLKPLEPVGYNDPTPPRMGKIDQPKEQIRSSGVFVHRRFFLPVFVFLAASARQFCLFRPSSVLLRLCCSTCRSCLIPHLVCRCGFPFARLLTLDVSRRFLLTHTPRRRWLFDLRFGGSGAVKERARIKVLHDRDVANCSSSCFVFSASVIRWYNAIPFFVV